MKGADVHKYFVRGQYINGIINETPIMSYHEEKGVNSDSTTETFVAGNYSLIMIDGKGHRFIFVQESV